MALPNFMLDTTQRIRDEDTTTLDDHFTRLIRDFTTVAPRTHNHVSTTIDTLNARIANNRFGVDYGAVDAHVESTMRAMIGQMYQVGTDQLFDDTRTRRERIASFALSNGKGLAQRINTDQILNLNRSDMLLTVQDHINEYHTTATPDERDQIANQLSVLTDRAHRQYNLRADLAALANTPYTILLNHGL